MTKKSPLKLAIAAAAALLMLGVTAFPANAGVWAGKKMCGPNYVGRSSAYTDQTHWQQPPGDSGLRTTRAHAGAPSWIYAYSSVNGGGNWKVEGPAQNARADCYLSGLA